MSLPSLVVFGSQTPCPSVEYISRLRSFLLNSHYLADFVTAIRDLPDIWPSLVEVSPSLSRVPGLKALEDFRRWIDQGDLPFSSSEILPNVLSTPLTVIIHISEYFNYLEQVGPGTSHAQVLDSVQNGGIQGLCTGLMAAISLACSSSEEDIGKIGAVALRLAVCIGAFVDLDARYAVVPCETSCFTVRWTSNMGKSHILDILDDYSEAYISVVTDTTSATITVPKSAVTSLIRRITDAGMIAKPISLNGRFHTSVHADAVKSIQKLCECDSNLRFPTDSNPLVPLRANLDGELIKGGSLEEVALKSMLVELPDWHKTITTSISQLDQISGQSILMIGPVDCVPRPLVKELNLQLFTVRNMSHRQAFYPTPPQLSSPLNELNATSAHPSNPGLLESPYPNHAIAVVGMGCRFPGADSVEEFWEVIQSGKSMLGKLPEQRFPTQGLRRSPDPNTQFLGNFIRDADAFDHRFFKRSSREAASMDPQHRLVLQVAYEALESSGYFSESTPAKDIGCYIGVAASDYEDNVASHMPTAFSVPGMVRAFTSGKISHFFGLNGPSMVFDTACSSSAVAIHTACKAIHTDECSMALAGGVNVITSPTLHQNLAAANFLSPTGASKSFDTKADGYCRGEGAGLVLLKKLSSAMSDNDNILGVIMGTAVNQNDNCSPITVPSSLSQSNLYQRVLSLASMKPSQVSYVEAHGTGTAKGDPIECQSIRTVFGGQAGRKLYFGSVKGNIGHTEAASGVAGLIKSLLMMQQRIIPMQASFTSLNPNIAPLEQSNMEIPRTNRDWHAGFMAACINNYGAAGSNAAMIVCQPPAKVATARSIASTPGIKPLSRYPFFISAHSFASLKEYPVALKHFVSKQASLTQDNLLASIAFNLAHKQNKSLAHVVTGTATSLADLDTRIVEGLSETQAMPETRPVVLVFAGQTGRSISFCQDAYRDSLLLQYHLNRCDDIIRSMHLKGLFPDIFNSQPIDDVVDLHCMLFSLQYSCAKSWLDSGLKVETVIGHSFGQLTALCVTGALSLEDCLRLIAGRASLIKSHWGPERGSMISLESDIDNVMRLISLTRHYDTDQEVEIACHNGPSNYVLVGTEDSVKEVEDIVADSASSLGPIKARRLDVTHGFHSVFVDNILSDYTKLAEGLTYSKPTIPLESCSKGESWTSIGPKVVAQQSREPVYFEDAIRRIEERLGACVWIEAGSGTPATALVRRAARTTIPHSFHPVKLGSADSMGALAETTVNLWKAGVKVQFWPFHRRQKHCYLALNLPPYQFEKSRHWLEYVDKHGLTEKATPTPELKSEPSLLSFEKFSDPHHQVAEFSIDQTSEYYKSCVRGHAVLGSTLCPASLYIEMAARAATILRPDFSSSVYSPDLEELEMYAPLGIDLGRGIHLCLRLVEGTTSTWEFTLSSYARNDTLKMAKHAAGRVSLLSSKSPRKITDFARYTRLLDHRHVEALLADIEAEAMQGSLVYKMFAKVVHYADIYQGVRKISLKGREVAGHVAMPTVHSNALKDSICNPLAIDNFTQVAGLHVNSLEDCGDNEVFLCTKIDQLHVGEIFNQVGSNSGSGPWLVYSKFDREGARGLVNDIFVFDHASKTLVMMILGVRFTKVIINSLRKALSRANPPQDLITSDVDKPQNLNPHFKLSQEIEPGTNADAKVAKAEPQSYATTGSRDTEQQRLRLAVKELLHEVADVPIGVISDDSSLDELGIDSLMATELLTEIRQSFGISIPVADFQTISNVKSLYQYIIARGGSHISIDSSSDTDSSMDLSESGPSSQGTPTSEEGKEDLHTQLISKLSKLVAEHLDTTDDISRDTDLGAAGLDSLLGIELGADIEKAFGSKIDMTQLGPETTFGNLSDMVLPRQDKPRPVATPKIEKIRPNSEFVEVKAQKTAVLHPTAHPALISDEYTAAPKNNPLASAAEDFANIRNDYGRFAKEAGFLEFRTKVYPKQAELVLAYVVEAFANLGCSLSSLKPGDRLPPIQYLPKHKKVMSQYYKILEDASLISTEKTSMLRTGKPISLKPASQLYERIISDFPQHASEHRLLNSTGSKLADCLSGKVDPLQVLFRSKTDKDLLEDVYTNSPMFATGTKILGHFFSETLSKYRGPEKLRILELGAGTGGTTKHIINILLSRGIEFSYTFTDLSSSMVAAAKKKFAHYNCMEYMVLDVEKEPPKHLVHSHHIILSSNCVHATKSLVKSSINIQKILRDEGFLCLLELTRNLFWLDCVFGLLEGWWLFEDDRTHVLADEFLWKRKLLEAGFEHVDWSDDETEESDQFRVIVAFKRGLENNTAPNKTTDKIVRSMETVEYHGVGGTSLYADIYYPTEIGGAQNKRPIALMIHGGGHIMLSRKDIRPKQTQLLLDKGLLPVSVDYRLCPEVPLLEGPLSDVCSALQWARRDLPNLKLQRPDIHPDGDKVVVVGWSTGGTLSMTLAWTAPSRGLKPPDAILAFYCPTNYSSDFWRQPNFPANTAHMADEPYDLLEGVQDSPITAYNVSPSKRALGGWMSVSDPRSRIALHMNWKGQALPVLLGGLPSKNRLSTTNSEGNNAQQAQWQSLPQPDAAKIAAVCPYTQIRQGNYRVPTYLIHGTQDDLIPWQQTQKTRDALVEQGVTAEVEIVEGAVHLFDLYGDRDGKNWEVVKRGYEFLFERLGIREEGIRSG